MNALLVAALMLVPVPEEKPVTVEVWLHRDHVPIDLKPGDRVDVGVGGVYPRARKDGVEPPRVVARAVEVVALARGKHPQDAQLTVLVRLRALAETAELIAGWRNCVIVVSEQEPDGTIWARNKTILLYLDRTMPRKP